MGGEDITTKPTLETVLERINLLGEALQSQAKDFSNRFDRIDDRLEEFNDRLDRIEALAYKTRSEFLEWRADFKEWRGQLKDLLPPIRHTS